MDKSLSYEHLIRTAYNCGRTCKHGADADIYRDLLNALFDEEDKDYRYKIGVAVGEVDAYLCEALYKIRDDERYKSNPEFISKIEMCIKYLDEPTPDLIDKCISEAMDALNYLKKDS